MGGGKLGFRQRVWAVHDEQGNVFEDCFKAVFFIINIFESYINILLNHIYLLNCCENDKLFPLLISNPNILQAVHEIVNSSALSGVARVGGSGGIKRRSLYRFKTRMVLV